MGNVGVDELVLMSTPDVHEAVAVARRLRVFVAKLGKTEPRIVGWRIETRQLVVPVHIVRHSVSSSTETAVVAVPPARLPAVDVDTSAFAAAFRDLQVKLAIQGR